MNGHPILYGLTYLISFTCIAFSTNAIFAYYSLLNISDLSVIITIVGGVFTTLLHPTFYRNSIQGVDSTSVNIELNNIPNNESHLRRTRTYNNRIVFH